MMSYCPVALKERRELVPVQAGVQSRFAGKVYQFSTEEAREAFDANPRRYMPALNGFDVVRNAFGERQVVGSLQYAAWYRGRLYLFQSQQTLQMFVQTPTRYVEFP
jgi:YHS domain-containing protein